MKYLILLILLTFSCATKPAVTDNFSVTGSSVGIVNRGMTVKDVLDMVPAQQIKKVVASGDYETTYDDYQYYDENNNHLLTLTPNVQDDTSSKINRILILDKRYKTDKNIGLGSTYADLVKNHEITGYAPDVEHIILIVRELNAWFSINKNQLQDNWWDDTKKQIDKTKIPASATFDTFVVVWK